MMHAAHALAYMAARYGGPPNVALRLGVAASRLGQSASWWASATPGDLSELAYLGPDCHLFPVSFPGSWFYSPCFSKTLFASIRAIDLFHLHQIWDYPVYAASRLARKHGKPYLITPHGIFTSKWRYNSPKKRAYLAFVARPMIDRSACLHALTPQESEGFLTAGLRKPATIIPNGVDPSDFSALPPPSVAESLWPEIRSRRVLLFMSRLSPEKGLDLLLQAWSKASGERDDWILLLAGPCSSNYQRRVQDMVAQLAPGSAVLTGMLTGQEKLAALSRANAFVLPSYSEGFSVAVLEAMMCSLPCLLTSACNFPEAKQSGAAYIADAEAQSFGEALRYLLKLPDCRLGEMGNLGRELVLRDYTWDIVARKMLTVYQCILAGKEIPMYPTPVGL